jgi:preprotein translocase SecE subunit
VAVFQPYAPEKAVISRWILGVSSIALFAFGAYQFYHWSPDSWQRPIGGWTPLGDEFPISRALVLAVLFFVAAAAGTWWLVNWPRFVDFLTDTESEMTKVSWSSKKEVIGSSLVVIATVIILGVWILVVDLVLSAPWGDVVRGVYHRIFG